MAIASSTIAIIGVVAALAAAGVGTYSAIQSGQAQKKAADYNAKVAEQNARLSQMQSRFDAERIRDRNRRLAASQRSSFAKSGVSIVSGSAYFVQQDQEIQNELAELTTLYRGNVEATGFQSQSTYHQMTGQNALAQANVNAAGSALSGVAGAAAQLPGTSKPVEVEL